jgi:hypothetical protein
MAEDKKLRAKARRIVEKIVRDLEDRRGLRQVWEEIDDDIRKQIKKTWADVVAVELNKP